MRSWRGERLAEGTDFGSWLTAREPALHRLATLLGGDEHAGHDLLRPVLARLCLDWQRIGPHDAEDHGRSLLLEEHRRTWERGDPQASGIVLPDEYAAAAWALVGSLPARDRAVVVLRHHLQRSDGETARLLRLPVGIVQAADHSALAALRAHLDRLREEHPERAVPDDPARLLSDTLLHRDAETAYVPSDPGEVSGGARVLRRQRRRSVVVAVGLATVLVVAPTVAVLLRDPGGADVSRAAARAPRGPTPFLSTLPLGGPPGIPYLLDTVYVAPDGRRTELGVAFALSAAPYGDGFLVSDSRSFDGVWGLHRIDAGGRPVDRRSTTSELLAGGDGRPVWVTVPGGSPRRSVIRRGGERHVAGPAVSLVGSLGNRVVYRERGSRGAWSTDLRGPPERIRGLRRVHDAHEKLVAGRDASGNGVVLEAGTGTVRWKTSSWRPVSFSPDGSHLAALPRRSRSHVAILAADGTLRGTIRRFGDQPEEPVILDLAWEDASHLLLLVAQYGRSAIIRADLDGRLSRATPPLVADLAGGSRYRFATP